jgi:hypothetical protein
MIKPYLTEKIEQEIKAGLLTLDLPRNIRKIALVGLELGDIPPLLLAASAAGGDGPPPDPRAGGALQLSLDWSAPRASATLAFTLANGLASQPTLRLRRPVLRGTLRVHWEWIEPYPYIGRVRFCFVTPPRTQVSLEPLGTIDVTQLPAVGPWVNSMLAGSLKEKLCYPSWVETDMRIGVYAEATVAAAAAAAAVAAVAARQPPAEAVGGRTHHGVRQTMQSTLRGQFATRVQQAATTQAAAAQPTPPADDATPKPKPAAAAIERLSGHLSSSAPKMGALPFAGPRVFSDMSSRAAAAKSEATSAASRLFRSQVARPAPTPASDDSADELEHPTRAPGGNADKSDAAVAGALE